MEKTSQKTPIQLAIFDLGNVVFQIDWEPMFQHWAQASGVDTAILKSRSMFTKDFEDFERGTATSAQFHTALCNHLGAQFSYEDFVTGWNAIYSTVNEEVRSALEQLQGKIRVVAFTNTNEIHRAVFPDLYREVLNNFEHIYISSDLGFRKPEAKGFEHIMNAYQVNPQEVVFFDDFAPNVQAACELGINGVLVDTPQIVLRTLRSMGILD